MGLSHGSQADLVVCPVEDSKVLADEDITQDPKLSRFGGDVHALEAAGAAALALEKRRIKVELRHRFSSDRRWVINIQGALVQLQGTCKEELPGSVSRDSAVLGLELACRSCPQHYWFLHITGHYLAFLAGTGTLTSASELRGLGRIQLVGRSVKTLPTQPFLMIILIPTRGKPDGLLALLPH